MQTDPMAALSRARGEAERVYHRALRIIEDDMVTINSYNKLFEEYPIVLVDESNALALRSRYNWSVHEYIKEKCKENNYLYISCVKKYHLVEMIVPTNRSTSPLVASLLLLAKPRTNKYNHGDDVLEVDSKARSWTFYFYGDAGKKLFDGWIEQCKENHTNQLILGFGPFIDETRIRYGSNREDNDDAVDQS